MLPVRRSHRELFGGVAQLGERTVRIRKVESSILFVSTKKHRDTRWVSLCFFVAACGSDSRKGDSLFTGFASRKWDKQKLGAKPEFDPLGGHPLGVPVFFRGFEPLM